jgi:uncharacterized protein GlcG (DUF336 family)
MSAGQNEGRHRRGVGTLMRGLPLRLAGVAVVTVVVAGTGFVAQARPGGARGVAAATPAGQSAAALPTAAFLPLSLAQRAANAAITACAQRGQQVAVTVVDRAGVVIVQLRNDGVSAAAVDASKGKAYASAGFGRPSGALGQTARTNPGVLQVPGFVVLAGGLPIRSGGAVRAGIGVGGAPTGQIDESCARAGIAAISASL